MFCYDIRNEEGGLYYAETIAKYIINWYHDCNIHIGSGMSPITNWRLNKLLYFLQGEYLNKTGKRFLKDEFYAWEYGPVIPGVYYTYQMYASSELPRQNIRYWIDNKDRLFIEKLCKEYCRLTTFDLLEISQAQDPWKYTVDVFGKKSIIAYGCFENYFQKRTPYFAI